MNKVVNLDNAIFINPSIPPITSLPESVMLTMCDYSVVNYSYNWFERLSINCPHSIKNSVKKRQAEYLAGRFMARCSLKKLGFQCVDIPIGKHRNPLWPYNILGSITHTQSKAICLITYKCNYQYLGVDLERILALTLIAEIKNSIINKQEKDIIDNSQLSFEQAFTLSFSAKESLFKALYPSVGYYFDFSAAEIVRICCKNNTFKIRLTQNLTDILKKDMVFSGIFCIVDTSMLTIILQ